MITSSSKFIAIIEWGSEYYLKNFADQKTFIHRGEGRDGWQPPTDLKNSSHHTKAELYFFHLFKIFLSSYQAYLLVDFLLNLAYLGPYITAQRPNPFLYIIHLMSDPAGNSLVFPRVLMFPETKWRGPRVTGPHSAGNSQDIGMDFGIDKCTKLMLRRGKVTASDGIQLPGGRETKSLVEGSRYEYL